MKDTSCQWLKRNGIPYASLIVTNGRSKLKVIREMDLNIAYFIEDRFEYAMEMAEAGIKVLLMEYPWNQNCGTHHNIIRIKDWKEIRKIFSRY